MNRVNLQKTIDLLQAERDKDNPNVGMDMVYWFTESSEERRYTDDCGTTACIGGHVLLACDEYYTDKLGRYFISNLDNVGKEAQELLGLTYSEMNDLFLMVSNRPNCYSDRKRVTARDAITVLQHLMDTGEVDWSIVGFTGEYAKAKESWAIFGRPSHPLLQGIT